VPGQGGNQISLLASDADNEYMMIDATIVALINTAPAPEKRRRPSSSALVRFPARKGDWAPKRRTF
jgi:hypothetical protein